MADVRRHKPNGLLIWGPQGCGKSCEAAEYAFAQAQTLRRVKCFVIQGKQALQVPQDAPGFAMDAAIIVLDDLQQQPAGGSVVPRPPNGATTAARARRPCHWVARGRECNPAPSKRNDHGCTGGTLVPGVRPAGSSSSPGETASRC